MDFDNDDEFLESWLDAKQRDEEYTGADKIELAVVGDLRQDAVATRNTAPT